MTRSAIFIATILAAAAAHSAPLATEGFVTNKIAAAISQIPPPDFSTGNTQLVATIEATAPIPTWDTLSGKPTFAPVATSGAYSDLSGKPTIPSTAADIGALPIDGGTMTGNLVMGYNSLFQINGGGNAKFQFSWGSALDNLIISAYRETIGSYSIRFPTREGLLALTSDIPTSMAWDAITDKPTTISGYGITDALKSDFTSLTNNAAFTSAVAAVSPPTDLTHVEAEIETNRTAIATLSARAYIEVVSADEVYYVFTTNQE